MQNLVCLILAQHRNVNGFLNPLQGHGHFPDAVFGDGTGPSNISIQFSSQLCPWVGWWMGEGAKGTSIY
jgi:hypothetical protein